MADDAENTEIRESESAEDGADAPEASEIVVGSGNSVPSEHPKPLFIGRKRVTTKHSEIDDGNVVDALDEALSTHRGNAVQIDYLWKYYKGKQPVLDRVKDVRPEINNKVVENHAQEIIAFKVGYQLAEPLQYTCRKADDEGYKKRLRDVNELNALMFAEDKASCDRDLFEWMCVGGVCCRMVEADSEYDVEDGGAPFEIFTLDPRFGFVAYSRDYRHRPVLGVLCAFDEDGKEIFNVFTDKKAYLISQGKIIESEAHTYGRIPIVEYRLNNARMGVFEPVLGLLDAINAVESNRMDGIEQTVQALMKFVNVDIDADGFKDMLALGAIKITSNESVKGDVDVIKNDLDQSQTQVTKDDLYQAIVNICGMPNRSGASGSSSDTGAAVLLRDGWTLAESHAKSYELQIKRAERDMLRVALAICEQSKDCDIDLRIRDIELAFNRRNYENLLVKSQVLTTMLKSSQIHPELAFQSCGLFTDPEAAYTMSEEHAREKREEYEKTVAASLDAGDEPDDATNQKGVGSQAGVPEPKR